MMRQFETPAAGGAGPRVEFTALENVLSRSLIARAERAFQRNATVAFVRSRSYATGRRVLELFRALPAPARLRLSGCALMVFVVLHVLWRFWMPSGVSPAMPMVVWVWVALFAGTLIVAPTALARAWHAHYDLRRR